MLWTHRVETTRDCRSEHTLSKHPVTMQPNDESLDKSMDALAAWWTSPHQIERVSEAAISASSMSKHRERLHAIVAFCEGEGTAITSVQQLASDMPRFQRFLDSKLDQTAGTRAALCNSFLCALKFARKPLDPNAPHPDVTAIRGLRTQLQRVPWPHCPPHKPIATHAHTE